MFRCIRKSPGHRCCRNAGRNRFRCAFTLLEAIFAITLSALLMTPVVGILRTTRELWTHIQQDQASSDSAHATLRHISRILRTAKTITAVGTQKRRFTELRIVAGDGQVCGWKHDVRSDEVEFSKNRVTGLLAENIEQLTFEGFDSLAQPTTVASEIRMLKCTATSLLKTTNAKHTASCSIWIRPAL